jgi:serine/threonine-protein kinase
MSTHPFNTDPAPAAQHAQTGRTLADRYLLLEKIGDGGTAEVFRARDERLGRLVALKLLRPQFVSDATWRKRFEAEARAAAGLSHPNIVDIYDVGEGPDGTLFIAMQYVEGPDLKSVLWKRGRLSPGEVIALSRQVCAALAVAHRSGLIHRDVKPQNILIDTEGNARLTDFGIVKTLAAPSLTQSGMTFGTAAYLSPEQATGMQVGPASDIYALGCVMYEMLSGAPPFTGDNPTTIAYKQVWEQPRPLHELVPEVPPSLESVVMRPRPRKGRRYL